MVPGLLGAKIGMTQAFGEDGIRISVTILKAGPCDVQCVKTIEKDGYWAIQVGFSDAKEKRTNKPQLVYLKKHNLKPKRFVREIRCKENPSCKVGDKITNNIFQVGDFLDIIGTTKGKGFQGGMKRHNWVGGPESHGSMSHRAIGSIGASSFPSRVVKGHAMAGHMGAARCTTQNLKIIDVNTSNDTIAVKGAVPGPNGSYIIIKYAKKKVLSKRTEPAAKDEKGGEKRETVEKAA